MNRLSFLKNLGLGAAAVAVPTTVLAKDKKPVRIRVSISPERQEFREWGKKHVTAKFIERNEAGIDFERNKQIDKAIEMYEANVRDKFWGNHPYERLFIIYKKQGHYVDARRVANAYLELHKEFMTLRNNTFPSVSLNKKKRYFVDGLAKLNNKYLSA